VTGSVTLPADAPQAIAARVVIEVRDSSLADVPAPIVASTELRNIVIRPDRAIPFSFQAPKAPPGRSYTLRVHVSVDGADAVKVGDLLTMQSVSVPDPETPVTAPVALVR
jgi:putative lipoprotein